MADLFLHDLKRCTKCDESKPLAAGFLWLATRNRYTAACNVCRNKSSMDWAARNRERVCERQKGYYRQDPAKYRAWAKARADTMRDELRQYNRKWRTELRAEMLAAYGNACKCCGEAEPSFLTLEHEGQTGAAHRRKLKGQMQVYCELRRLGWPQDGFAVLCANCNMATARGAMCPHEIARRRRLVCEAAD